MPKTLAVIYALLIAVQVPILVASWQHGVTGMVAYSAASMGFLAGLAAAVWMNHTIRG